MLAYAANAPRHAERCPSPNAMLIVIAVHIGLIAAVMSAKMDLPQRIREKPIVIDWIEPMKPPPANQPVHHPVRPQAGSSVTHPQVSDPQPIHPVLSTDPIAFDQGILSSEGTAIIPEVLPTPTPYPVKVGPQLLTPISELKPPYPHEKLLSEGEALLKLRLTIDEHGRVTAVEPIGRADPVFLRAARQYLLAHWRYRPAFEDGRAITSSAIITLHFTLEG